MSVNKRTGFVAYLVPELCLMTGLTDIMKDDFKVMRDIKREVLTDAPVKVKECQKLFSILDSNQRTADVMKEFDFQFIKNPLKVKAVKYEAGNYVMGKSEASNQIIKFDIESNGRDLEKKVQNKMFEQPPISKWGIFY